MRYNKAYLPSGLYTCFVLLLFMCRDIADFSGSSIFSRSCGCCVIEYELRPSIELLGLLQTGANLGLMTGGYGRGYESIKSDVGRFARFRDMWVEDVRYRARLGRT